MFWFLPRTLISSSVVLSPVAKQLAYQVNLNLVVWFNAGLGSSQTSKFRFEIMGNRKNHWADVERFEWPRKTGRQLNLEFRSFFILNLHTFLFHYSKHSTPLLPSANLLSLGYLCRLKLYLKNSDLEKLDLIPPKKLRSLDVLYNAKCKAPRLQQLACFILIMSFYCRNT